jgi:spore coat protein A
VLTRRQFLKTSAASAAAMYLSSRARFLNTAYGQIGQGLPLPGNQIPQFVDSLPDLFITGATSVTLEMREFLSNVMPSTFLPGTYQGTYVWGYRVPGQGATYPYIGPVILAVRGTATQVTYVNLLGKTDTSQVAAWVSSTDQTLHWADPANVGHSMSNYVGPIPAVPHLHGGEVPPVLDGGPDAWFLSDAYNGPAYPSYTAQGHAYYGGGAAALNQAIYKYPNTQEAANIWFHDHVLGATRLNVYAGMAGAYLLSDPGLALPPGLTDYGLGSDLIVPVVIQDRKFDVTGQLFFDNVGINLEHPFWVPEFVGDTIVVNGKVWPTFGTALAPKPSKRYRFLFLNGSNARTYELFFIDPVTKVMGPPMWVIGSDGGYLDTPAKIDPNAAKPAPTRLVLMPGERYDVIVDFNDPAWRAANPNFSGTLILRNTGNTPYPKGAPPTGATLGQVMKLFIGAPVADTGYDPASGVPLRPPMIRLVNAAAGSPAAGVTPVKTRQLTLNEVMGPGGPLEVLVNNTKWGGLSVATDVYPGGVRPDFTPITVGSNTTHYSELPVEGDTELWEIVNITADAHPIHLHLVQFQLMNRQKFNLNKYVKAYDGAFPGSTAAIDPMTGLPGFPPGVFIPAFGPPLNYNTGNPLALGGNPDITPFLQGPVMPPANYEAGWKDTVVMYPGQVTRIMVRWAPTDLLTSAPAGSLHYPFDPKDDFLHGYVWHCHIIDHEDNEMMRPDVVELNPVAPPPAARPLQKGTDY